MTLHYPIVFETETSGAISAYVPGLPVYAAADTQAKAERAIRDTLRAYLEAHPGQAVRASMKVAKVRVAATRSAPEVAIVSPAALLGSRRSPRKAASSRANGRLGGRPRRSAKR